MERGESGLSNGVWHVYGEFFLEKSGNREAVLHDNHASLIDIAMLLCIDIFHFGGIFCQSSCNISRRKFTFISTQKKNTKVTRRMYVAPHLRSP